VFASHSHRSDVVGLVVFLAFLAWMFAVSVMLVVAMRRGPALVPQAAS